MARALPETKENLLSKLQTLLWKWLFEWYCLGPISCGTCIWRYRLYRLVSLIRNVIDSHAPIKSKIMRKRSVLYMNSKLRKAQFARNMSRNKFKRFGGDLWEENKRHRNNVVNIRKKSLSNYFATRCEKHDDRWKTVSPFMSDKKFQNGCGITLEEDGETISEASKVSEVFNNFFISVASEIGLDENIVSDWCHS